MPRRLRIALILASLGCTAGACARSCPPPAQPAPAERSATAATAKRAFSMRPYYLALLRRGPKWTAEQDQETRRVSEAHMAHIEEMARRGVLVVAGPFDPGPGAAADAPAGLFLFDVENRERAVELAESDPGVKAGRFSVEVLTWYGPAGLTYDGR
ncbi:MAG TPA: YciI family protein [Kofleriaceae bacterium]|nr:YciI family protein [Kofleriaceae bacterium]